MVKLIPTGHSMARLQGPAQVAPVDGAQSHSQQLQLPGNIVINGSANLAAGTPSVEITEYSVYTFVTHDTFWKFSMLR